MKIVNKEEYDVEINEGITLVDFFANWCGPCKMLSPVLEEVAKDYPSVKFIKVDCDESPEIAARYNVMSIPTLLIFKDGQLAGKTAGYQQSRQLHAFIDNALK